MVISPPPPFIPYPNPLIPNLCYPQVLEPANLHVYRDTTLGQFLEEKKYSRTFTYNYVVPMCAAVWSVPNEQVGIYCGWE